MSRAQRAFDRSIASTPGDFTAIDLFDGEFSFLPFEASVRYGEVPLYPTSEDFHNFVSTKFHEQRPAAHWHLEAIRWRRKHPGKPLNDGLKEIAIATAAATHKTLDEDR